MRRPEQHGHVHFDVATDEDADDTPSFEPWSRELKLTGGADHLNKRMHAANPPGNTVSWHAVHGRLSRLNRLNVFYDEQQTSTRPLIHSELIKPGTLSVIDLVKRAVIATVPVGSTPTGVAIDAAGTTAWVASVPDHKLVPVSLVTDHAGTAVALDNAPGDLALPAASGVAWVLFPSSNGSVSFLDGTTGPFGRSIHVGNGPELLIGTGSETSWVANALTNTVQRINAAGQSAGRPISVFHAPSELKLTPDGTLVATMAPGLKLSQNGSLAGVDVS